MAKTAAKGKKPKKIKPKGHKGIWKTYTVKGDSLERKNRACPKCGSGYQMAGHKSRVYCGKCGYTEFMKKDAHKSEISGTPEGGKPNKETKAEEKKK